jgi:hypothetical protein
MQQRTDRGERHNACPIRSIGGAGPPDCGAAAPLGFPRSRGRRSRRHMHCRATRMKPGLDLENMQTANRVERLAERIRALDDQIRAQEGRLAIRQREGRSGAESMEFLQILRSVRASYADHLRVLRNDAGSG